MSENSVTNPVGVPREFVDVDQWICWREEERDGKPTKIPITPGTGVFASSTDPETWTNFETALEYIRSDEADGLGFVFSENDPFVGIDLDDCRDPETSSIDDDARDIVNRLDSYTEISPSGTGFHVLVEGELPEGGNRHGSVEMYESARFFTMTGDRVDVKPQSVEERQDALVEVHREYVQEPSMGGREMSEETTHSVDTGAAGLPEESVTEVKFSDEELLEKARNASNGEKFDRLWRGGTSGYPSQSEADMALCCLLAFWTGGDAMWVDQLFRKSDLYREKWDEIRYSNEDTYGERTVKRAIDNTGEFYEPSKGSETAEQEESDGFDEEVTAVSNGPSAEKKGAEVGEPMGAPQAETSESTETAQTEVGEPIEPTEAETGGWSDGRERAYLNERNKVLSAKFEQREATVEGQRERIETLETELTELRTSLASTTNDQMSQDETSADESDSLGRSIWEKAKRLVDGSHS
ncbi:hypothetical protein HUG10_19620 (plasmid) [Halorarum halophilum]|uniref:NrS-1 polymerase-like HBD domain-containing protein n=1 Tax=Halorarum halophilum TaxID=2743090 RepID=A0A7D5L325_9EURY|nr:hypothetical protein [Halobaculum halophilum]QLG29823.1 hypothetical protein HUG10_19620 [Halobaculum halophilum]